MNEEGDEDERGDVKAVDEAKEVNRVREEEVVDERPI